MKIIIEIETEEDPSTVLDLAIESGQELCETIATYGKTASFDENKVTVEL